MLRLEIPVFPTVTAKVSFEEFEWKNDLEENFFKVPRGYKEDRERFVLYSSCPHQFIPGLN